MIKFFRSFKPHIVQFKYESLGIRKRDYTLKWVYLNINTSSYRNEWLPISVNNQDLLTSDDLDFINHKFDKLMDGLRSVVDYGVELK
jgi:hypothetical protein